MIADILLAVLLGGGLAVLTLRLILHPRNRSKFARRSLDFHHAHHVPISRLGGLGLAAAFIGLQILVWIVAPNERISMTQHLTLICCSLAMFGLGFWDDLRPLGARRKLLTQIIIALVVCASQVGITQMTVPFVGVVEIGGWGVLVTVIWLVALTNLINLIDGADGLAGGIGLMLMMMLAFVAKPGSYHQLLAIGMAAALVGFLWFNFPPAKIYLGDGGAYFLGFQVALMALVDSRKGELFLSLASPLFVLALPIIDTSLAIVRRGLRGLPVFRPDKRHLHHHLLSAGLTRKHVVLAFYALTLIFLMFGLAAYWTEGKMLPYLIGLAAAILIVCATRFEFSRNWLSIGRVIGNSLGMRQEIQYALCLTGVLRMEGARGRPVDDLWKDLQIIVERLGFVSISLQLEDGVRRWQRTELTESSEAVQVATHSLLGGTCGTLELKAFSCENSAQCQRLMNRNEAGLACPCVRDEKLFELLTEIVAEGWLKAVAPMRQKQTKAVSFEPTALRWSECSELSEGSAEPDPSGLEPEAPGTT